MILVTLYNTSAALSLLVSATFKQKETALTVAPLTMIIQYLFTGFIISFDQMPVWLRWLQYPSFLKYAFQAFAIVSIHIFKPLDRTSTRTGPSNAKSTSCNPSATLLAI